MDQKNIKAATLQKKKTTINKAKVKKTIKTTLCRPDPVFWPNIREDHANELEMALAKYKVEIPEFNKPHWKELKLIPKDQRPKQPKIKKVEGLIFGISQCNEALISSQCSAVIIESTVNPRAIVQPLIDTCISNQVPLVCLNGLRKITSLNFGIPTSCLAVKSGFLQEFQNKIEEIAKLYKVSKPLIEKDSENVEVKSKNTQNKIEIDDRGISNSPLTFTYLYRSNKSTRIFNPSLQTEPKAKKAFIGQDFIEFSDKPEPQDKPSDQKAYMGMILKRITNNQNRTKRK